MISTYIDYLTYSRSNTGIVTSALVGNSLRLSSSVAAGATTLPVMPASGGTGSTADVLMFSQLYIFDGASSEIVTVGADATFPATSVTLLAPGCVYAHAQYVLCCSDGAQGSLATAIFEASRWLEDITHQSLYAATYTNEILSMPGMRASIGNQSNLMFRPMHFPITALSALSIQWGGTSAAFSYDATQAVIDSQQRTVNVTNLIQLPGGSAPPTSPWPGQPLARSANASVTITYAAGFAASALPWAVTRAATLLTNAVLSLSSNAIGADQIRQGKREVVFTMRGDISGESLLLKQAAMLLSVYTQQVF